MLVTINDIPNNDKLTSIKTQIDNEKYKIVLGRKYVYMIDYTNTVYYKVKQNITILNHLTMSMTKSQEDVVKLVNTIKEQSFKEMQQHNLKRINKKRGN